MDNDNHVEDHKTCNKKEISITESELLFDFVYNKIATRLNTKGCRGLSGDTKECLEHFTKIFKDKPVYIISYKMIKNQIRAYLDTSLEFMDIRLDSSHLLALLDGDNISKVSSNLF